MFHFLHLPTKINKDTIEIVGSRIIGLTAQFIHKSVGLGSSDPALLNHLCVSFVCSIFFVCHMWLLLIHDLSSDGLEGS